MLGHLINIAVIRVAVTEDNQFLVFMRFVGEP
jgi:hypothetical protein